MSCKLDNLSNVPLCSCTCARHVHSVFLCFAYTRCFDSALVMLLLVNKIIICDGRRVSKTIVL